MKISIFYFVGQAIFSVSPSFQPPPYPSLSLINKPALAILAFLWFFWSWHALACSASLWLPGHCGVCSLGPVFACYGLCGRSCIVSVLSEGCSDSGGAGPALARFMLPKQCFLSITLASSRQCDSVTWDELSDFYLWLIAYITARCYTDS